MTNCQGKCVNSNYISTTFVQQDALVHVVQDRDTLIEQSLK